MTSENIIFEPFWKTYTSQNPHVKKIYDLFLTRESEVINDHIALRTFDHPQVNIDHLANLFEQHGYQRMAEYEFPVKKLFARHFEHENPDFPKVFISELKTGEFSDDLQSIINQCVAAIPKEVLESEYFACSGVHWGPLSYETYEALLKESEYAAWCYAFGFCANHFTVNVNRLTSFDGIQAVNDFLKTHGFALNTAGGEIKGTPSDYLEQSSTMAGETTVAFKEGEKAIPCCYYEFAKRYPLADGSLYSGFVAASADKIFESTNVK